MAPEVLKYGPVATRLLFENDDVKVWEMDLKPGEVCGLHHHTHDYVLFILEGARVAARTPGREELRFPAQAREVYFMPAGGKEAAHNVDTRRFLEVLFEIKRPAKPGSEPPGFVLCGSLAGREPEPGVLRILDNDRVRVSEITLVPGGRSGPHEIARDSVSYVAEGGTVRIVEKANGWGEKSYETTHGSGAVEWTPRGPARDILNVGTSRYRQVTVEIK